MSVVPEEKVVVSGTKGSVTLAVPEVADIEVLPLNETPAKYR